MFKKPLAPRNLLRTSGRWRAFRQRSTLLEISDEVAGLAGTWDLYI